MTAWKLILAILAIGLVGSALERKDVAREPTKDKADTLDFSRPIYTTSGAMVCPLDILFERREGKDFAAAARAAKTVIGRSKAIADAGCEEWHQGIQIYISHPEPDLAWQKATAYQGGIDELLVLKYSLSNAP